MNPCDEPYCHSWCPEHESRPTAYLNRLSPKTRLRLSLAFLALGAFSLSWLILQYAAQRIESTLSNGDLMAMVLAMFGAVLIPSTLLTIVIIQDYVAERREEIESVRRYEETAKLAVDFALVRSGNNFDSLRHNIRLSRPPRKPLGYGLTSVSSNPATCRSGPQATYVCVCITVRKLQSPTVKLRWVEATSVNAAFNALAPSHGWETVTCSECEHKTSVAYQSGDSLVLIRLDDRRHTVRDRT